METNDEAIGRMLAENWDKAYALGRRDGYREAAKEFQEDATGAYYQGRDDEADRQAESSY